LFSAIFYQGRGDHGAEAVLNLAPLATTGLLLRFYNRILSGQ
jgi:hypothetical protein